MRGLTTLLLILAVAGCNEGKRRSAETRGADLPPAVILAEIPLGDIAGGGEDLLRGVIHNPYDGNAAAVQDGESYFHKMNCVACHGYGGRGGMGPNLRDSAWRYGGSPAEIYKSISEGRPKGMPAWGAKLTPEIMWKLTAYIQSLGGAQRPEDVLKDLEGWAAQSPKGHRAE
jgi:cytochrome c oxidase cbb3-type subunit 3